MAQVARQRIGHQGYTLVEVLIAMVILLSLMFTANYSYSLYSQYWAGRLGSFDRTMFQFQGMLQIKETIDAAIPYIVEDSKGGHTFYFLGRDQGFTLVTVAPIFAVTNNDAAVVRIFAEKTPAGYQLVYEEAPLTDQLLVKLDQTLKFTHRTVLMHSAEPLRFSYHGWQLRAHKHQPLEFPNEVQHWSDSYDAAKTRIQPSAVQLHMGTQSLRYQLATGHDKLMSFYIEENVF